MNKRKYIRLVLLGFLLLFVVLQFLPVDRTTPEIVEQEQFVEVYGTPQPIRMLLKDACNDCHTYKSTYPWYAYVAPLSMWIQGHIDHGREHFNLSAWTRYPADEANFKLGEAIEEVEEKHMPLNSYLWGHPEARLSDEQRSTLANYFREIRK